MSPADHYRTISAAAELRQKVQRSEFLGLAFPLGDEAAFFAALDTATKRYFDATHHCWAFRLFPARQRSSDAGEPAGTAGKPILAAIEGAALHDVGVIVVRWFGGVKLGTGGLSRAYCETAAQTLQAASVVDRYIYRRYRVTVPFASLSVVYRLVDPPAVVLIEERYAEETEFLFDVRASFAARFEEALRERRLGFHAGSDGV